MWLTGTTSENTEAANPNNCPTIKKFLINFIVDQFVYIKHLTPHDQVELEEIEEKYHNDALRRGVPTEDDMLIFLKDQGDWSEEDDKFIQDKQFFIESLKTAKNKMVLKREIDHQKELIDTETNELIQKQAQKVQLLGNTCEKYAKDRLNDFYMIKSFYKNSDLSEKLFSENEFDQLEHNDIKKVVVKYNEIFEFLAF